MKAEAPALGASEISLPAPQRAALGELLLSMADDEFVLGYWDSEWTGIAPMLEEDVAFSSIAQDEVGHARVLYEMLAQLQGGDADEIAYGREPGAYRHARLLNHARGDWAFSIARRYLYDTADSVRLATLSVSSFEPLAQVVAKIRREETYHLMHMDAWLRRLGEGASDGRTRLETALSALWPDALTVFTPLDGEAELVQTGLMQHTMAELAQSWLTQIAAVFAALGLPFPFVQAASGGGAWEPTFDPRLVSGRTDRTDDFQWLWSQFTMVRRQEAGATW